MKLVLITLKNQTWKVIKLLLLSLLSTLYMYHTLNDFSKNEIYCDTGFILLSEFLENICRSGIFKFHFIPQENHLNINVQGVLHPGIF